jgi:hypothetical protein
MSSDSKSRHVSGNAHGFGDKVTLGASSGCYSDSSDSDCEANVGRSACESGKSCDNGFAKFNMVPGATGTTGNTGATGSVQLFTFTTSLVNNGIVTIDPSNANNILVLKDGWYSLDFQYTLINAPTFITDLYYYTGILVNGVDQIDARRYEHMIAPANGFSGVSNPKSTLFVRLAKGNIVNVYFDSGATMAATIKANASSILNVIKLS